MSKTDIFTDRSFLAASISASALFLFFSVLAWSDYSNHEFAWVIGCKFGGNCGYAVSILGSPGVESPVPTQPPFRWFDLQFIFLNPGLWFGVAFSSLYSPTRMNRALPPLILGTVGLIGLGISIIFPIHWSLGYKEMPMLMYLPNLIAGILLDMPHSVIELAGIFLVSAPYSILGAFAGYTRHLIPKT